ncbi:class I SAM-dependent methyltransferase [Peribacillus frigoritolerans]|uniref:class I SAM-dependent methyltransferase n=1 Tax=Peribacillus frigoritolerans TaxID=450367 RepID=UPI0020799ABB|nr:class I SAM-dependent methyltransferase [Peribacillus frigoritolerans]USK78060.1 class I SAM-dependent methyltransferase [Peribacillus frigoritolerans]WJE45388.1 class I SAM-dependent methyltransferase [Peribacillus frigoritolerans]
MDINQYISNISFSSVKPQTVIEKPIFDSQRLKFEVENTILPENDKEMKDSLSEICKIPKMSTLPLAAIINKCVSMMDENDSYVNVGVWNGFSYLAGLINNPNKKCVGIDNFSSFGGPRVDFMKRFTQYKSQNHDFYDMDYLDYLKSVHKGSIGFYFYDGPHDYKNQLEALQLAERFFSKNCIIMIDDTNWDPPRRATLDFISSSSNDYDILLDVNTYCNGHPTFWNGVMILKKIN